MPPGKRCAAKAKVSGAKKNITPIKKSVGSNEKAKPCKRSLQSDTYDESHSDSSSFTKDNSSSDPSGALAIRRPMYWLEMRGIKSSENSLSGTGKKKISKPKACHVRKDPPSYPAGSCEEKWYLEILDQGKINCPTCHIRTRKTVEGLKKHMSYCREVLFTCQHCGKQLKSAPGMKYHIMADHCNMPVLADGVELDDQSMREQLRLVLRQMGRLKCSNEGCPSIFTSVLGYLYHMKKCGKEESELEQMAVKCHHCGKAYQSRAGLMYHLKAAHRPGSHSCNAEWPKEHKDVKVEESCVDRTKRRSAKVAIYHLHEIATEELIKEWPKRKVLQDLVPDERKLKYTRPGLPTFSQEVTRKWKSEMKAYRRIRCPNKGCESVYSSVSGLKAHLGCCAKGDFVAGKYKCLLCDKEFGSESGVKYHINWVHCEEWFVANSKSSKIFEKLMKMQQKDDDKKKVKKQPPQVKKKAEADERKTSPVKETPSHSILEHSSKRMRSMPSESDSENSASSHSSMEEEEEGEEMQPVIWRARQPLVKPAALTPVKTAKLKTGLVKEAVLQPGLGKTTELKPGLIKAAMLNPVFGKTTELKPGLGKTTTLKPGLIKAAVLKLDRRRK
ncbi:zinc finger protein 512 isoform X2 [Ambystoma mexicanum]|uniref:zinc finger protein 512 isoform X2 n=1 Tax=Ambystoma mexicanum TaxID=8296 RepID=UPI0037E89ECD